MRLGDEMSRAWTCTGVFLLVALALAGCNLRRVAPADVSARIIPSVGTVPYEATIRVFAPPGTVIFELPDETIGPQSELKLDVTVDSLNWSAVVTWSDGSDSYVRTVEARGSNPQPEIQKIVLNGKGDLWQLEAGERTLIEAVIWYNGECHVESFTVASSISDSGYTVFYPPYEPGVCHAFWNGWIVEDACIVYPLYCSIETGGLPISPCALDAGYPVAGAQRTNVFQWGGSDDEGLEIPEHTATVTVKVRDEWGRLTARSFGIPVQACDYEDLDWLLDEEDE